MRVDPRSVPLAFWFAATMLKFRVKYSLTADEAKRTVLEWCAVGLRFYRDDLRRVGR